jgi:hypothetical protein
MISSQVFLMSFAGIRKKLDLLRGGRKLSLSLPVMAGGRK